MKIKKITKKQHEGYVYNITTTPNSNYYTEGVLVHNCDVTNLPFKGNLTKDEIVEQIKLILDCTPYVDQSQKVKIGFARMGEPAHNLDNVARAIIALPAISNNMGKVYNWLPCFNTILPSNLAYETICRVIDLKENWYDGFLHFQISCNSTDEEKRKELFGGANVLSIEDIIKEVRTYNISNRTVTLNFIVIKDVEVDVKKLKKMGLDGNKFAVKLIPLNNTANAQDHGLQTYANYSNYEKLLKLKDDFEHEGVPVVVDAIAKCEEAGLCCGQIVQTFQ